MDCTWKGSLARRSRVWGWLARAVMCVVLGVAGFVALGASASADATLLEGWPTAQDEAILLDGGPTAEVAAGGLVLSLRVERGPYFLSELVAVKMTLSNRSLTTYTMQGTPRPNNCAQAVWIFLTGGEDPQYTLPVQGWIHCAPGTSTLLPGQTWTVETFLPLTASGAVTLTAHASFLGSSNDGPFAGRWPAVHLTVAPTIPPGRMIALDKSLPDQVTVTRPQEALAHLFAVYEMRCNDSYGMMIAAQFAWRPINGTILREPDCSGNGRVWTYAIGAPGYAVASGAYPPNE
jgi:hypothetical protein